MTAAASSLRATIERLIREALPLQLYNVASVGETTVHLAYGDGVIEDVPCSSAYSHRRAGDRVWVLKSWAGNWEVLCASNVEDPDPAP